MRQNGGSWDTSNASNEATDATTIAFTSVSGVILWSSDIYVYGTDIVAVLAIGACVFYK